MRRWKLALSAFCAIGLIIAICLFGMGTATADHNIYSVDNGLVVTVDQPTVDVIRITVDRPSMEVTRSQAPNERYGEVAQYKFSKHNVAADSTSRSKRLNTGVVRSQAPIGTNCDEQRTNHVSTLKRWANEIELDGI